jgi:hypothetical protein
MKRVNKVIWSVSLAFFMMSGLNAAAQDVKPEVKKNGKAPEILFEKLVHDYGVIYEGDPGECEFTFKNTGKEPLVLSNVYSSCGCTVPDWPKDPIMPGKSSVIKVRYATSRVGGINKTITVISNAEENPKIELRITGNVKKKEESTLPEKQPNSMQAEPAAAPTAK